MTNEMNIKEIPIGTKVTFVKCNQCTGKHRCFFCKKGVKNFGSVVARYPDFDIPTVEVKVVGSERLLELTQVDLNDSELVESVKINSRSRNART